MFSSRCANVRRLIAGKICCRYRFSIETHSLPALARCYPHSFTFYVAYPIRSILTCSPRDELAVVGGAAFRLAGTLGMGRASERRAFSENPGRSGERLVAD